jgi:ATP-dependent RNA helicase DDX51/DBP6
MSRFYARYVPPTKTRPSADDGATSSPGSSKRKLEESGSDSTKRRKKIKTQAATPEESNERRDSEHPNGDTHLSTHGRDVLEKYRLTRVAKANGLVVDIKEQPKTTSHLVEQPQPNAIESPPHHRSTKKKDKKSKTSDHEPAGSGEDVGQSGSPPHHEGHTLNEDTTERSRIPRKKKKDSTEKVQEADLGDSESAARLQRHAAVLSKFERAKQQDRTDVGSKAVPERPPPELHGLEPIPQPEPVEPPTAQPTYSVLPPWQENPLIVPTTSSADFGSFTLSKHMLSNLSRHGFSRPLPIQATVLPLLMDGPEKHDGDLCVSAATGSGKTLSYVLPIIASLKDIPDTKLRAVIVVPTRELVKQVRELCDICSAGTAIRLATAVGSKSLAEEQQMLINKEKVYSRTDYWGTQRARVNWTIFSLSRLAQIVKDEDPFDSMGYVTRYTSKVDVLITTPGRLVDHLKSTPGFTLDHVKWLVVDEADRLLNESYQEWVAVVKPALESRSATAEKDELLRQLRVTPRPRTVTKLLLSATMTRDLSKLEAVGLRDPKLVVLGGNTQASTSIPAPDTEYPRLQNDPNNDAFHLPDSLKETAISIPDGSEKPLFVLELIRNQLGINSTSVPDSHFDSVSASSSSATDDTSSSEDEISSSSEDSDSEDDTGPNDVDSKNPFSSRPPGRRPRALVFARSTASAERLSRLLCILDPQLASRIATLTRSTASSASSRRALASFRSSKISILIATDRASRGLDVPELEHVVSYDIPNSPLTYVHRVGRTARAGRPGQAWTIVEHREAAWFWREIGGKRKTSATGATGAEVAIQRIGKVSKVQLVLESSELRQRYENALKQLGEEILDRNGRVAPENSV